ncbi:MAG: hypothetical protein ABR534_00385 [Desulfotignum sp.]
MTKKHLLSVHDISRELAAGTALTNFILKRFHHRFPVEMVENRPWYPEKAVSLMRDIKQSLESGMLPSQIEETLDTEPDLEKTRQKNDAKGLADQFFEQSHEDIRISKDGLHLITSFFNDMGEHQKKITAAHEKRASAEERKAAAIEKRAEAEEKKAAAMNNIAAALQQMIRQGSQTSAVQAVTHEAVKTIQMDEDLTDLLDTPPLQSEQMDDLGDLIDAASCEQNNETDLDDLSLLVDTAQKTEAAKDLDDLNELFKDDPGANISADLDDLSLLVQPSLTDDLDDLSRLISDRNGADTDTKEIAPPEEDIPLDDLTTLVDTSPSLKPDVSRDQDLEKYKAAVMKIIMGLKSQGVSASQAARRLNQDNVETISKKPEWTDKAISQIYAFIDAAAG